MFKLGTFSLDGRRFLGLVVDDRIYDVAAVDGLDKTSGEPFGAQGLLPLLEDWDRNFERLSEIAAFAEAQRDRVKAAMHALDTLVVLPPIIRPPKILCAAANYRDHFTAIRKTFSSGLPTVAAGKDYDGDKSKSRPYLFLKANNALAGPNDDIVLPPGVERLDWEAELGVVIGRRGKNIPQARAMDHVAGFLTFNDVSCRAHTWREDRPGIRSDWLGGKSWDTFAPMGPYFMPRAFVPDHANLRIWCAVNGDVKQDGNSADMVFNTEEQIVYAARMLTLEPGDVIATGTPAGTGQERLEFLKVGDVVEVEVGDFGRQRNRIVAGSDAYGTGIHAPA